jgi:UDP-N-acetyl-D-mannosaminuronate dehydrogenase
MRRGRSSITLGIVACGIGQKQRNVIATAHASVNCQELADWAECIVDTRNVMVTVNVSSDKGLESVTGTEESVS